MPIRTDKETIVICSSCSPINNDIVGRQYLQSFLLFRLKHKNLRSRLPIAGGYIHVNSS